MEFYLIFLLFFSYFLLILQTTSNIIKNFLNDAMTKIDAR